MESKTSKRRTKAALREEEAIKLRLQGFKYREIANRLNITEGGAYQIVKRVLERTRKEASDAADELKQVETERLEDLLRAWWNSATAPREVVTKEGDVITTGPDPAAANVILRISERLAKLWGLDAPAKQDMTSNGETISFMIVPRDENKKD